MGAGCGGLGIAIDYNKWAPIKSVHAVVGYAAMALLILNFLGGYTMYVLGKGGAMRGTLKPLHKRAGMFALCAGMNVQTSRESIQSADEASNESDCWGDHICNV